MIFYECVSFIHVIKAFMTKSEDQKLPEFQSLKETMTCPKKNALFKTLYILTKHFIFSGL